MLVVLINESEGKAWKRTRRVLAKYLPQVGSRVWSGHISEEGLKDVYQDIKKVVSKSGSVACHRMVGKNRMELQWIAGKKDFYDEQGRYAFRTTHALKDYESQPQGPYGELLYLARGLSALLHDIGKATQGFQGKMYGYYNHEEYRHDLVGFLMLRECFALDNKPSDDDFLDKLGRQEALWANSDLLFHVPDKTPNLPEKHLAVWLKNAPVFTLISWLVLTHHRLPDGFNNIEVQSTEEGKKSSHVNGLLSDHGLVAIKQESQKGVEGCMPWEDNIWLAQVSRIAKRMSAILQAYPDLRADLKNQTGDWILANAHHSRPMLITADHLASIQCNRSGIEREDRMVESSGQVAYANTYKVEQKTYWGDTVTQHLRRVEKVNRKLKTLLQNISQFRHATLPMDSLSRIEINKNSDYYWQQLLADRARLNLDNRPVFAAILAETGSGKTLAGVRLMDAVSRKNENGKSQLRYTLALGLRALTLQSGMALRDQAKIAEADFATMVGGLVFNFDRQSRVDSFKSCQGSENAVQLNDDGYIEGGIAVESLDPDAMSWINCLDASMSGDAVGKRDRQALFEVVKSWIGVRGLKLMDTPVVACTVDHIVHATHATSGGDARMAMRIFTSDLVLDEIDNYSAQDLVALGKLCFMSGLSGRHVILMSATMSPFVVQGLFDAWWRGLSIKAKMDAPSFNAISPPNIDARLIFASNQKGSEVSVHDIRTKEDFNLSKIYGDYVKNVCLSISINNDARRVMDILRLTPLADAMDKENHVESKVYDEILSGCRGLHQSNNDVIGSIKVSVGFVRFNTAKQAWLYSKWLLQRDSKDDDFCYRVVCYHSKHPRLVLGIMDEKLNKLNNRKDGSDWNNLSELQLAIAAAKEDGKRDLIIIVVTTTLQETGRDHDYDWNILEPRSVRGEIQAAGRVRRHRKGSHECINVLIMSQPMRAFDYRNNSLLWGLPGVETSDSLVSSPVSESLMDYFDNEKLKIPYKTNGASNDPLRISRAEQALPIEMWKDFGFDAKLCLTAPGNESYSYDQNPIGSLEHFYAFARLSRDYDSEARCQSLKAYLDNNSGSMVLALTKKQHELNEFRKSSGRSVRIYCCYSDDLDGLFERFYQCDFNGGTLLLSNDIVRCQSLSAQDIEKVFFGGIEQDVCSHFLRQNNKSRYKPQDALFCDLSYFGDNFNRCIVLYHWALGYLVK